MRLYLNSLIATIIIGISPVSMSQTENVYYGKPTSTVVRPQIVTRSVPVLAKKIVKPKLFVGKPRNINATDWDNDIAEVDDVITSYRRKDLNKVEHEDGISDQVRWRLFLARQLALFKYREIHG